VLTKKEVAEMAINKVYPTLPVVDIERAKKFYQEKLGFKLEKEDPSPGVLLKVGRSNLYLYQRGATKADHTEAAFIVKNVEGTMKELREKGVVFEEYDLPNLKTVNGLFSMDGYRSAWFKDTEGNIIAISNM
jgi:catechol 2,3-dioxygenase-like lactoylglutathione lyase family enzyme